MTLDGAPALLAWETDFLADFGPHGASFAVHRALAAFHAERQRVVSALLQNWQAQVARAEPPDLPAREDELAALFGPRAEQSSALCASFQAPLLARKAQLREHQDAEDRRLGRLDRYRLQA